MSKEQIILVIVYAIGVYLSRAMMTVEHESEGKNFTKLDRIICFAFSLFSFVTVLLLLVSAWFKKIGPGYWNKPAKRSE